MSQNTELKRIGDDDKLILNDIQSGIDEFVRKYQSAYSVNIINCEMEQNSLVEIGYNYASKLTLLKLDIRDDEKEYQKSIVMKIPQWGNSYESLKSLTLFEKECYMYSEVLPRMLKINRASVDFAPLCYMTSKSGLLCLENLYESGYKIRENKELLDLPHLHVALKTIARFQATTVKYLQLYEDSDKIDKLKLYLNNSPELILFFKKTACTFMQNFVSVIPEKLFKKIELYFEDMSARCASYCSILTNGFHSICHGDLWITNFFFQYDQKGAVNKFKMIDFQASHRNSPVVDLLFLLISCVPFKTFNVNRESLIEFYLKEFNETLNALNCGVLFNRSEFDDHFQKYLKNSALLVICVMVPIMRSSKANLGDFADEKVFKSPDYVEFVLGWIKLIQEKCDFFDE